MLLEYPWQPVWCPYIPARSIETLAGVHCARSRHRCARSPGADVRAPRPSRRRRRHSTHARGIHTARRARRPRPRPAPTDSAKRQCTEAPHNNARMQRSATVSALYNRTRKAPLSKAFNTCRRSIRSTCVEQGNVQHAGCKEHTARHAACKRAPCLVGHTTTSEQSAPS